MIASRLWTALMALLGNADWGTEIMKYYQDGDSALNTAVLVASSIVVFWRAVTFATVIPEMWISPMDLEGRKERNAQRDGKFEEFAEPVRQADKRKRVPHKEEKRIKNQVREEFGANEQTLSKGEQYLCCACSPMLCCSPPYLLREHAKGKKWTYTMMGLPFIGPVAMLFAGAKDVDDNPLLEHMDTRLTVIQLLIEDIPSTMVDIYYITNASEGQSTFWYSTSLAMSSFFLLKAIASCVKPLIMEERETESAGDKQDTVAADSVVRPGQQEMQI